MIQLKNQKLIYKMNYHHVYFIWFEIEIKVEKKEISKIEYGIACIAAAYIIVYIYGRVVNSAIPKRFMSVCGDFLEHQFAKFGYDSGETNKLIKDGEDNYTIYSYGRRNCSGMIAHFQLKSRQDLISVLWNIVSPAEDTLVVDIPLPSTLPHMVFAVCRKRDQRSFHMKMKDLV